MSRTGKLTPNGANEALLAFVAQFSENLKNASFTDHLPDAQEAVENVQSRLYTATGDLLVLADTTQLLETALANAASNESPNRLYSNSTALMNTINGAHTNPSHPSNTAAAG